MDRRQELSQNQIQKLSLSPAMLTSLELLSLPIIELRERIEREVLENPALELNELSKNRTVKEYKKNLSISPALQSEQHNHFIENLPNSETNLQEYLLLQLSLRELPKRDYEIGEIIVTLIDDDGFFKEDLKNLFPDEYKKANDVLELIQSFDPAGIAALSPREAILYQISISPIKDFNIDGYNIVKECYDLLLERDDAKIAKKLNISMARVKSGLAFLKKFNPFPGREYSQKQVKYIIPDAIISIVNNEISIKINDYLIPQISINKYMKTLYDRQKESSSKNRKHSKEEKYIANNINRANQFIDSINWRKNSLQNLIIAISIEQKDFFYNGPLSLKPLTMKEIAKKLELSESTISRLSNEKYIATKWGIFELRYFFSNSIKNRDNTTSQNSIKEMIKNIITNNDNISDSNIVKILNEDGVNIARRTVAKYRKSLNIENSFLRNVINNVKDKKPEHE